MHTETIFAFFGAMAAALLIICSVWLIAAHGRGVENSSATPGKQRELRMFEKNKSR